MYMEIKQGKQVRQSPKADSEKNTELPRTGFEPVTTGLLVCTCKLPVDTEPFYKCFVYVNQKA